MSSSSHRILAGLGAAGLCAGLIAVGGTAQAADVYTNPVTGHTSTYQDVTGSFTWDEADAQASSTPAPEGCTNHLAVITSADEEAFVEGHLGDVSGEFLGAQRQVAHADFTWVTGEAFDYTNWADGEPNDYGDGEDKLQFAIGEGAGRWNDIAGTFTGGYVLETECPAPADPPAPSGTQVTSVSPASGPTTGGTSVTITGRGFTGTTKVFFGSLKARFVVDSDTQITATAPAFSGSVGAKGRAVNVRVRTRSSAKSPVTPADRFTYYRGSAGA